MSRRPAVAALSAIVFAFAATAQAQNTTPAQESGSPIADQGSNYNYRSNITAISPSVPGLKLEVLEFADRLVLTNHTGRTVTIYGYQGEPFARVLADGAVEENVHSPAYYLNQNFYGDINVPADASPSATPDWMVVDRTGQLEWHDHRIHWMSPVTPPQVKDKSKRTKIFNWQVPIRVGATPGVVNGQLFWVPEEGTKTPTAAIVALIVIVLIAIAFVVYVRRRRARTPPAGGTPKPGASPTRAPGPEPEAW